MAATAASSRRPALSPKLLDEVVVGDLDQRFAACIAVTAAVWGHGFRACSCSAERAVWMERYREHLEAMCNTLHST